MTVLTTLQDRQRPVTKSRWTDRWVRKLLPVLALLAVTTAPAADAPLLDLGQYQGRIVVVDFWASWCVPCRRSVPWLNEMQKKYAGQGLVVVGVNVDKDPREAEQFLAETPAHFRILYDAEGRLPAEYGVVAMPSSYVFDRTGQLITRHLGFQNARRQEYEDILIKALSAQSGTQ